MTSDQILTAIAEIEHTTDAREIERAQVRAIAEVAYQLALLNQSAALSERTRCAKLAEKYIGGGDPNWDNACEHIATEIRRGTA